MTRCDKEQKNMDMQLVLDQLLYTVGPSSALIRAEGSWKTVLRLKVGYLKCSNHDDQKLKLEKWQVISPQLGTLQSHMLFLNDLLCL